MDISPWPQILAMAMMAAASVALVRMLSGEKMRYGPLILSSLVVLTPFTAQGWLYKFDAPCMALSVLASVVPFLFLPERGDKKIWVKFGIISVVGLLIMWTTYQASSGVYVIVCIGVLFRRYLRGEKLVWLIKIVMVAGLSYVVAAAIFRFALPEPEGYRAVETLSLLEMPRGIYHNSKMYWELVQECMTPLWAVLIGAMVFCCIVSAALIKQKNLLRRFVNAGLAAGACVAMAVAVCGVYLLLAVPYMAVRALIGAGVMLAVIALLTADNSASTGKRWRVLFVAPGLALAYSFTVFYLALGNAMADVERYGTFRTEMVVADLAKIYPDTDSTRKTKLKVVGRVEYPPVARNVANNYPIVKRILTPMQDEISEASGLKVTLYNNREQETTDKIDCDAETMEVRVDNYYHIIKANGAGACVILKNGEF